MTSSNQLEIMLEVLAERDRQEEIGRQKRAQGVDWRSCADPEMAGGDEKRVAVLGEEVGEVAVAWLVYRYGEVARAVLEAGYGGPEGTDVHLREEVIQVAAVAIAIAEAIDRRNCDRSELHRDLRTYFPQGLRDVDGRCVSCLAGRYEQHRQSCICLAAGWYTGPEAKPWA